MNFCHMYLAIWISSGKNFENLELINFEDFLRYFPEFCVTFWVKNCPSGELCSQLKIFKMADFQCK